MADNWYILRDDKRHGPYSGADLRRYAASGHLLPIDLVVKDGMAKPVPAAKVKGLFAASTQGTATPLSLPVAAPSPPLAAAEPMRMGRKLLGAIPASIFWPVIGMTVVIGLGLLTSFFCGSLILFLLSFMHIVAAAACIVLAVRLQKFLYAPLSALLTMTLWGWYCFSALPLAVSIPGLLAGIAVGVWALFVFRSPEVKALFADAVKPGLLDRTGTPVLAGIAGVLLVVILGIGGGWHMVSRDKSGKNSGGGSPGAGGGGLSSSQTENSEYKRGYKIGSDLGERSVNGRQLDDPRIRPSAMKEFNKQKRDFEKSYQDLLRSYGPDHDGTLLYRGMLDGYTDVIAKAGIDLD